MYFGAFTSGLSAFTSTLHPQQVIEHNLLIPHFDAMSAPPQGNEVLETGSIPM